jgi:PPOX class probable F420-dependent enzyme
VEGVDGAEMRGRVREARVGRLGTVRRDGRPHLVPVCFVLVGDVVYSAVDHKPKRSERLRRLDNLRANPAACLLVDGYEEDWARLWWVRVDGTGRVLDAPPGDALAALVAKYPQYAERPPGGPTIALAVDRWSGWTA